MNIKKIISIILCALTISSLPTFSTYAAKSANLNNTQIVNKVNLFNSSRLEKLDYYIFLTDIESSIVSDLVNIYKRLDNLIVSDIATANDLLAPDNIYDSISVGSQLESLFSCLFIINYNCSQSNLNKDMSSTLSEMRTQLTETHAKLIIEDLNDRLDQIEFFKNKNNK